MTALLVGGMLVSACSPVGEVATRTPAAQPATAAAPSPASAAPPPTAPLPATGTPTTLPSLTPTADPYEAYTIEHLANRTYGGGELQARQTLAGDPAFTRKLFSYPSDGLTIYGFMDVPTGAGPYPVVIALHGYIDPASYQTLDYTS